jgi:hypothetical protein
MDILIKMVRGGEESLTSMSAPGVEKFLKGGFRLWMYSKNLCSLLRSHATCKERNKKKRYGN